MDILDFKDLEDTLFENNINVILDCQQQAGWKSFIWEGALTGESESPHNSNGDRGAIDFFSLGVLDQKSRISR